MSNIGDLSKRQAGILMPVFSIPSESGIGEFGDETRRFLDDTAKAGFKIWQILPFNPVGYGNSPYQPYSSFAGDEIYISLDELKKDGFLDEEIVEFDGPRDHVDYDAVRSYKNPYLRKAWDSFEEKIKTDENLKKEFEDFKKEAFWLDRYALFRVLKAKNNNLSWDQWPKEEQELHSVPAEYENEVEYQRFLQFMFDRQWKKILDYAHNLDLTVVGDIPIYVGHDSADVWQFAENFHLDDQFKPTIVAGCPPDYFSEDGQLWGNPIYNWEKMKENGYDFWLKRFDWNKKLFDVIRIDHFIGFDRYWSIPAGDTTAKNGHWETGPQFHFFDTIYEQLPELKLIAEDLGVLRPEVTQLKNQYGMLGMRIGQYSLGPNEEKEDFILPEACIIYTGTHDNDPVNGWYDTLSKKDRKYTNKVFKRLKLKGKTAADKVVNYSLNADPRIAIIPMQDFLNLNVNERINRPNTIGSPNWEWRTEDLAGYEALLPKIKKELKKSNRLVD